jgi:hypothetical protein
MCRVSMVVGGCTAFSCPAHVRSQPRALAQRNGLPRFGEPAAAHPVRLARFDGVDGHVPELQPHGAFYREAVVVLVFLARLLAVCKGADQFAGVAVVGNGCYARDDPVPVGVLGGRVVRDFGEEEGRTAARDVHHNVVPDFPFEEPPLYSGGEEGICGGEEVGEEDARVDAVHVEEVELDLVGWLLCSPSEVNCEK